MTALSKPKPTHAPVVARECDRVIRASCLKMGNARHERGGPKILKNMQIIRALNFAREVQNQKNADLAAARIASMLVAENAPLIFTVTDEEEGAFDDCAPFIFAVEATEALELEEAEILAAPAPPLSSALNDALAKIAEPTDTGSEQTPSGPVNRPSVSSSGPSLLARLTNSPLRVQIMSALGLARPTR